MEKITPINPAHTQYDNQDKHFSNKNEEDKKSSQRESTHSDCFESQQYSPYTMYNNQGQVYHNHIAKRIISMCSK